MEEQQGIPQELPLRGAVGPVSGAEAFEAVARTHDGVHHDMSLGVDGVHCAGCIRTIETGLSKLPYITKARLNFTTHRLAVSWEGPAALANDIAATVTGLGYDVHPASAAPDDDAARAEERFILLCMGIAGFAAGNIMLFSVSVWSSSEMVMGVATQRFMELLSAAIGVPAVLFSGRPFFRSALKALRAGRTNMDVPISIGLALVTGMSLFAALRGGTHTYFDSATMLMFFLLIGRYFDLRARRQARASALNLLDALSGFAGVVEGERIRRIPAASVVEGMRVRVAAGEKFPVDGEIESGETSIDTALITGESTPRAGGAGDAVYAGTLNISAPVTVRVTRRAQDTLLSDIARLMEQAGQGQARYVRLADRVARAYTPVVHTLAALAFAGWFFIGGMAWQDALMIAVTVLIITCPCALGLAVPVVQVIATGQLFRGGILVKSGDALERIASIDTLMLDKTGTLTLGRPALAGAYAENDLQVAASLAAHSRHPFSRAIAAAYAGALVDVAEVQEHPGQGVSGRVGAHAVRLGSRAWCGDAQAPTGDGPEVWLAQEGRAPVRLALEDRLRDDAGAVLDKFRAAGIRIVMATGDRDAPAQAVAQACGITEVYAEMTPPGKYALLERLRDEGRRVLMVGDGLNDAPVLAGAQVSMAPGSALDMAQKASDIVFMGDLFAPVYTAYRTGARAQRLVWENFMLAGLYNAIAIPLAFMGLVTPFVAAIAMSASSVAVIVNSFRLRWRA